MTDLASTEAATARCRAYLMLGRLFLRGVTRETLEHVRAVEPLADELASLADGEAEEIDLDEAAAAHQDVFGFNVFAFHSPCLDEPARPGGRDTERLTDFYRRAGFPVVQTAESADHVGVELNFLGFLSKMEAENVGPDAQKARGFARDFLDEHLLRWMPALRHALHTHGHPFYRALADLTLETLLDHRRALQDGEPERETSDERRTTAGDGQRETGEALLADPKTGLRDIAEHLLVPVDTGIYLSRASIRALSRHENLPAGFGSRDDMMSNLLRSAADYDGLETVTKALSAHVDDTRQAWRAFADELPAVTQAIAQPWLERLDHTEQLLDEIRDAVAQ